MQDTQKPISPAVLCWHVRPYAEWHRINCTDTAFEILETNLILRFLYHLPRLEAKLRRTIELRRKIPYAEIAGFSEHNGLLDIILLDGTICRFPSYSDEREIIYPTTTTNSDSSAY